MRSGSGILATADPNHSPPAINTTAVYFFFALASAK